MVERRVDIVPFTASVALTGDGVPPARPMPVFNTVPGVTVTLYAADAVAARRRLTPARSSERSRSRRACA